MSIRPDSFDAPIPDIPSIGTDTAETQARKKGTPDRRKGADKTAPNPKHREDFERLLAASIPRVKL